MEQDYSRSLVWLWVWVVLMVRGGRSHVTHKCKALAGSLRFFTSHWLQPRACWHCMTVTELSVCILALPPPFPLPVAFSVWQ